MTPEQLKQHIDTTMRNLQQTLTLQQSEIKQFGETTTETAKKITKFETDLATLSNDMKDALRRYAGAGGTGQNGRVVQSVGEQFINSDEYKNMIASRANMSAPFSVRRLNPRARYALTTDDPSTEGVSSPPLRVPGFISPQQPALRMRDLIPVHSTTQGSVEYIRTTGFFPVVTYTTADLDATDTVIAVESNAGFVVGFPVLIGKEERYVSAVNANGLAITISQGLSEGHDYADHKTRVVSRVAPAIGQGKLKPTGEFTDFSLETESVKTIPTSVDVARQALDDVNQLRPFIDNQLMFEMGYTEEFNLLYGTGGSTQLHGILTDSDIQPYLWSSGAVQSVGDQDVADTKIDALRRAITLVQLARYPADGIVVHPSDWQDIELVKGSDGHYLWISVTDGGAQRFFQYPVVVTDAIMQGTALTGAFSLASAIWDREQANIRISEHHNDNFKRNIISLLAEERLAHTLYRPEAYVEVTFDSPPDGTTTTTTTTAAGTTTTTTTTTP